MGKYAYYAISPPDVEKFPQNFAFVDLFIEPYYEPAIDRGCYGVVIYDRLLEPQEIAGSGLVSEARE